MTQDYGASIEAWRAQRLDRLRQPHGWLSLVGLHWLTDGDNRLGTDPACEIVLTRGPLRAGRLIVEGGRVRAWSEPNAELLHAGEPAAGLVMVSDTEAGDDREPTALDLGSLHMIVIRRGDRLALRVWDAQAPLLRRFSGIPVFPIDRRWRVEARLEPAEPGRTIGVPSILGESTDEPSPGRLAFAVGGAEQRLDALEGDETGELFLVFGDATNDAETYGGGRFLYTGAVDADGSVVVDFNRAYNPPCVFTPYATCPLPPSQNRLPIRIEAGEKLWTPDG